MGSSTAVKAFEDELGAQPPLGFFDPLGLLAGDVDQERFDRLRYVEIKHGRICMLAFLGQTPPVPVSSSLEISTPREIPSLLSLTELPPLSDLMPSLPLDLFSGSPLLDSSKSPS